MLRAKPRHKHTRTDLDFLLGLALVLGGTCCIAWWWTRAIRLDLTVLNQVASVVGYSNAGVPRVGHVTAVCPSGQPQTFGPDLAPLKQQLGGVMGQPLECEHLNTDNGDVLQRTTTGLAVYEPSNRRSTFTDGWRHWALTSTGTVTWVGIDSNPPLQASQPSDRARQQG